MIYKISAIAVPSQPSHATKSTKIQNSYTFFDVSTDGLINLSDNDVPSDVINEMVRVDAHSKKEIANKKDMKDPLTDRKSVV